jgi:hypothetical protein
MLVAVAGLLIPLAVLAVLAVAVLARIQPLLLVQLTLAVAAVVVMEAQVLRGQAAQASSSFHTQAQHNYLVVELLPNQAVTSFTHSHLLAHLALCHLYLQVTW